MIEVPMADDHLLVVSPFWGGVTLSHDGYVAVRNVAPSILLSGATTTNEGSDYFLTLGAINDPGRDTITDYIVNWGDNSPLEHFSTRGVKKHKYLNGTVSRTIQVGATDEDGTYMPMA